MLASRNLSSCLVLHTIHNYPERMLLWCDTCSETSDESNVTNSAKRMMPLVRTSQAETKPCSIRLSNPCHHARSEVGRRRMRCTSLAGFLLALRFGEYADRLTIQLHYFRSHPNAADGVQ